MLRGDAGIGKTALLEHLIDAASGFRVVHAIGIESEMAIPFAALHQLCASMLDRLDALPEPQRNAARTAFGLTVGTPPDRLLIGLAVLNLLSAVSEDGPLLCVVDGAQWLDRESAQALAFVARRLLADPVGLVFATCWPLPDLAGFPELVVEGLHDARCADAARPGVAVPVDVRVRDRIVAETRGNPLALVEWPRGLTPAELAGGFGLPALLPMAGQIEESFRRRVAELPPATQRFLTVAAAEPTGDAVIVWAAASTLGVGPHDARRRSTPGSSSSVSGCGSVIPSHGRRPTRPHRSPIGRRRTANSRKSPTPTAIPIGKRGIARSDLPDPTKTSRRRSNNRPTALAPGADSPPPPRCSNDRSL